MNTIPQLAIWGYILIFLFLLTLFPMGFASVAWSVNHRQYNKKKKKFITKPAPSSFRLLSFLPWGTACAAYYAYHEKYGWTRIVAIIAPIFTLFRFVFYSIPSLVEFSVYNDVGFLISVISWWMMIIGLVATQLLYFIVYCQIARWYRFGIIFYILLFILPQGAVAYMTTQIPQQEKERDKKQNDRFAENYNTN